MVRCCVLITAVVALANRAQAQSPPPKAGDLVILECLGDNAETGGNRYLDGRTGDGTVGLAAKTGGRFTGTLWKLHHLGEGTIQLECLGDVDGPRWLDGVTGDATVRLTDDNRLSGTF
jgi:hypothetical protein